MWLASGLVCKPCICGTCVCGSCVWGAAAVVGTRNSRHVADTCRLIGKTFPEDARREMDEFLKLFPQIEGDCFDIERQPGSRHIAIMRMNLVDSTTGK